MNETAKTSEVENAEMIDIAEVREIDRLIRAFTRHPGQANRPHEADAELLPLGPGRWLAATIDGISSEISTGLYRDPFTIGWVLVMANMSDLAAVGATPIGLLNALNLPPGSETWQERLVEGIDAAARSLGVHVLGGDRNEAPHHAVTGCALGLVEGTLLTRMGLKAGDSLFVTGPVGSGNALGMAFLGGADTALLEVAYRPVARLEAGRQLRGWASAMMDTSDGLLSTLDHLARLNGVGIELDFVPERLFSAEALASASRLGAPSWPLAFGEHGEYELVFAVPANVMEAFAVESARWNWSPVPVGRVFSGRQLRLVRGDEVVPFDAAPLRNLSERFNGDWAAYAREFWAFGAALGL